jgi:hypothetical protein
MAVGPGARRLTTSSCRAAGTPPGGAGSCRGEPGSTWRHLLRRRRTRRVGRARLSRRCERLLSARVPVDGCAPQRPARRLAIPPLGCGSLHRDGGTLAGGARAAQALRNRSHRMGRGRFLPNGSRPLSNGRGLGNREVGTRRAGSTDGTALRGSRAPARPARSCPPTGRRGCTDVGESAPRHVRNRRPRQRFREFADASVAVGSEVSLEHVLQKTVETAAGLVAARYAALGVLDRTGHTWSAS